MQILKNVIYPPSQALLILIDGYKNDVRRQVKLIKLYLRGENKSKLNNLFKKAESLKEFLIDFSPKAFSNCPVRRYFESHLVFNDLQSLSSRPVISIVEEFTDYLKSGITCYARVVDKELADKFAERDNLPFLRSSSAIEKDIDDGYECG